MAGMWMERHILVMPSLEPEQVWVGLPEIGVTFGFLGVFGWAVQSFLTKYPVVKVIDVLATAGATGTSARSRLLRARRRPGPRRGPGVRALWRTSDGSSAGMAERSDAADLKSAGGNPVQVRVLLPALACANPCGSGSRAVAIRTFIATISLSREDDAANECDAVEIEPHQVEPRGDHQT